jgi:hypothetical protein
VCGKRNGGSFDEAFIGSFDFLCYHTESRAAKIPQLSEGTMLMDWSTSSIGSELVNGLDNQNTPRRYLYTCADDMDCFWNHRMILIFGKEG